MVWWFSETPSVLFSPRVKESMDLYEEILTEEIKDKDSSYEEVTYLQIGRWHHKTYHLKIFACYVLVMTVSRSS